MCTHMPSLNNMMCNHSPSYTNSHPLLMSELPLPMPSPRAATTTSLLPTVSLPHTHVLPCCPLHPNTAQSVLHVLSTWPCMVPHMQGLCLHSVRMLGGQVG